MPSSVTIVVVNWNAGQLLDSCLRSIARSASSVLYTLSTVVVVDNASGDQSLDSLKRWSAQLPMLIIRNTQNLGFAAACNQGARAAPADYILFLNPDVFLGENALERAVQVFEDPANPRVGICGVRMRAPAGESSTSCARFPDFRMLFQEMVGLGRLHGRRSKVRVMSDEELAVSGVVDQVIGAFFMVRRCVFEHVRGFDEGFFLYFEEVDFALRAKQAGYMSYYVADAQATHLGGGSSRQVPGLRLYYSLKSRIRFARKHFTFPSFLALLLATITIEPCTRLAFAIKTRSASGIKQVVEGYSRLLLYWARRVSAWLF